LLVVGSQVSVIESQGNVSDAQAWPVAGSFAQVPPTPGAGFSTWQARPLAHCVALLQGCPSATFFVHLAVMATLSRRQNESLPQREPSGEQSAPSARIVEEGPQVPAQHWIETSQLILRHVCETHSSPAKHGCPSATVPWNVLVHAFGVTCSLELIVH
jgi:hypothetical protein